MIAKVNGKIIYAMKITVYCTLNTVSFKPQRCKPRHFWDKNFANLICYFSQKCV